MDMATGFVYKGDAIATGDHVRIEFQFVAESPEQLEELYKSLNTLQFKKVIRFSVSFQRSAR